MRLMAIEYSVSSARYIFLLYKVHARLVPGSAGGLWSIMTLYGGMRDLLCTGRA